MKRIAPLFVWLALLLVAGAGFAHEVLHEVVRGRAIAVKLSYSDGEAMAYAAYEVFRPSDPRIAYQKGRTDRSGYLAFVPDIPGKWRVKVADDSGHGLDTEVDVASLGPEANQLAPARNWNPMIRPVIGVALVALVFGGLFAFLRRRGAAR